MMKKLYPDIRTGVIGVGSMGQNHARIYNEVSNLIAVADPNEVQGREVAERFGVVWYSDYRDMLEEVDAVTVSVPTVFHREVAECLAESGIHLLVEKPLAGTISDAQAIVDAAGKAEITLAVGHIERHNEVVKYSKEHIERGDWGDVLSITARRFSSFPERISDVGVLYDLTIHDVDVISYLIGEDVKSLFTMGGKALNKEHEDHVILSMKFDNAKIGLCETNWLTPMKIRDLSIKTDKFYVYVNYMKQEINILSSKYKKIDESNLYKTKIDIEEKKIQLSKTEPLVNEIIDFLQALSEKKEPLVTGNDGLRAVKIIEACLRSLETNSITNLNDI